ncbi:hypothetical protein HUT19_41200 [Streptomyces sp. NA02950]|uniref:hypothetical protein n=1 Tax=Streptomyces sp. NA02950 TaxID=2742137 RepID=UPI001590C947|nr:hypothetical protein [Streptomyces sp. NA02950]QKV90368.1 hypothetical protein HUT19_00020 [Streptomyces sp. NA02950]QKV97299.1 hypothetical protein HUT19_41200 [Streptomyces sp. NA02950]
MKLSPPQQRALMTAVNGRIQARPNTLEFLVRHDLAECRTEQCGTTRRTVVHHYVTDTGRVARGEIIAARATPGTRISTPMGKGTVTGKEGREGGSWVVLFRPDGQAETNIHAIPAMSVYLHLLCARCDAIGDNSMPARGMLCGFCAAQEDREDSPETRGRTAALHVRSGRLSRASRSFADQSAPSSEDGARRPLPRIAFESEVCTRCSGTGRRSFGRVCFKCNGTKRSLTRRGQRACTAYQAAVAKRCTVTMRELEPGDVIWHLTSGNRRGWVTVRFKREYEADPARGVLETSGKGYLGPFGTRFTIYRPDVLREIRTDIAKRFKGASLAEPEPGDPESDDRRAATSAAHP